MTRLRTRSVAELLAERRSNINEARHERNKVAKELLLAHVGLIDAELRRRDGGSL